MPCVIDEEEAERIANCSTPTTSMHNGCKFYELRRLVSSSSTTFRSINLCCVSTTASVAAVPVPVQISVPIPY